MSNLNLVKYENFKTFLDFDELKELVENDEIDQQTFDDTKEMLVENFKDNVDNITLLYTELKAEHDKLQALIKHYQDKLAKNALEQQKLLDIASVSMSKLEIKKIKGNFGTLAFRKSTALEILNVDEIPKIFLKKKESIIIDKIKLKEEIKREGSVSGAKLVEKQNLIIK